MAVEMLKVKQVAELVQISPDTVYRLARRGKLPARKVGGAWRFSKRAIAEYMLIQIVEPPCPGTRPSAADELCE